MVNMFDVLILKPTSHVYINHRLTISSYIMTNAVDVSYIPKYVLTGGRIPEENNKCVLARVNEALASLLNFIN